jgi:hypothetical protein
MNMKPVQKPRLLSSSLRKVTAERPPFEYESSAGSTGEAELAFDMEFRGAALDNTNAEQRTHLVVVNAKLTMAAPSKQDRSRLNVEVVMLCIFELDTELTDEIARNPDFTRYLHQVAEPLARRATQQLLTSMDIGVVLQAQKPSNHGNVIASPNALAELKKE